MSESPDPVAPGASEADPSADAEGVPAAGALCLIEPRLAPEQTEALSTELGCPVLAVDPRELGERLEPLHGAAAIVVPWDAEILHGLDLVDAVRRCEDTLGARVLVAAAEPTRAMVLSALRAGADGFVFQPYQASELRARLATPVPPQAAPEGDPS